MDDANVDICLLFDGSPQRNGLEIFAIVADFFFTGALAFLRRLLPVISIMPKCLIFGLSASALLELANRVRSITADFGTERLVVQSGGILEDFWGSHGRGAESFCRASHAVPSSTPDLLVGSM